MGSCESRIGLGNLYTDLRLLRLGRSIRRPSDVRRAVATHGATEGCEGERETGRFEQRVLSAWMPNYERSPSHLKFADGLQARSTGASRLILLFKLCSIV